MRTIDYVDILDTVRTWFCIDLNRTQLEQIMTPDIVADIRQCGFDTVARGALASQIGRYAGVGGMWPTCGDGEDYARAYFRALKNGLAQKGIDVMPEFDRMAA